VLTSSPKTTAKNGKRQGWLSGREPLEGFLVDEEIDARIREPVEN
tara:strand:- start:372 stop:506 length:135 start_codon:yes stop_codon:yes gene_type:complete